MLDYRRTIKQNNSKVTVHTGLCIYCTDRKKMIQGCKNPIAEGNFKWIFADYWSRSEQ